MGVLMFFASVSQRACVATPWISFGSPLGAEEDCLDMPWCSKLCLFLDCLLPQDMLTGHMRKLNLEGLEMIDSQICPFGGGCSSKTYAEF